MLAIDLYCGLGGWTEGLLAEGWDVIGFDIEQHVYGDHSYPAQLVVQDATTLHGSQFKDADLIVASPPCQEYSYMAMPWTRAKQIARALRGEDEFPDGYKGSRTTGELNTLFDACFRLQREASEAAGRQIPMVVENVKGAQPWVGRAAWNFGSYYLWGDVPALMPITVKRPKFILDDIKNNQRREANGIYQNGRVTKNTGGSWFGDYETMKEGVKQRGSGREWFAGDGKISRMTSSNSPARKAASAMIAKIPFELSRHIAAVYRPYVDTHHGVA